MSLRRFAVEARAELDGMVLRGYASVFDQAADLPGHSEVMARSAFDKALADESVDVRALWNHNADHLLGRQSSGTLRLRVDDDGLAFEVDLPDTSVGRDVAELVRRGDLSGASFGFLPGDDEWSTRGGVRTRTHLSVERLVDVSPVTWPAYAGASVSMRAVSNGRPSRVRSQMVRVRARLRSESA